jgi:hypothetical protein
MGPSQGVRNLEPVCVAQANVEQDSVGQETPYCVFCLGRAARFTDDDIPLAFQQLAGSLQEDRLVVDHQDAHGHGRQCEGVVSRACRRTRMV